MPFFFGQSTTLFPKTENWSLFYHISIHCDFIQLITIAIYNYYYIVSSPCVELEYNFLFSLVRSTHFSMNRMSFIATVVCIKLAEIQLSFIKWEWCHKSILHSSRIVQLIRNIRVLQLYTLFKNEMKFDISKHFPFNLNGSSYFLASKTIQNSESE